MVDAFATFSHEQTQLNRLLFLLFVLPFYSFITKTRIFKYIEKFTSKNGKCLDKNSDFFHISAKNIDCGYSLEPP